MKNLTCLVLAGLMAATISRANILRVNNNPGVTCSFCYTTIQSAHDAASGGDTLYVEPSGSSYGSLTMSKGLVIIGNGYYLGALSSNFNPDLQANIGSSAVSGITFNPGCDNSIVMGLHITTTVNVGPSGIVSNIIIRRNRLMTNIQLYECNNLLIAQNYIHGSISSQSGSPAANLQINNNIIGSAITLASEDFGVVNNNVIGFQSNGNINLTNSTFWNNIMVSNTGTVLTGCDVRNNIGNSTQFGTANGNQENVTMSTVFEDLPNASGSFSEDSRWQITAGGPAQGAATDGGDCGAFGNANGSPYQLSGIPNIPTIYKLNAPATTSSSTLSVTISTRTNQ